MSITNHINLVRFVLERIEDESGVSGTGVVAEGVEFSDGSVALRWRSYIKSTVVYESIRACEAVHGHGGRTRVVYIDDVVTPMVKSASSESRLSSLWSE